MDIRKFEKKDWWAVAALLIISVIPGIVLRRELGLKDAGMASFATFLLLIELWLLFRNKKSSVLLFILSLPILVTARKFLYMDFLFIKISYESIYILFLFITCFKEIIEYIKKLIISKQKSESFLLLWSGLLLLFAVDSSIYSHNVMLSLSEGYFQILIPIMLMLSVIVTFNEMDRSMIYYVLIGGIDFSSLYGFLQVFTSHISLSQLKHNRDLLTFGYNNLNIYAGILMTVLPLLFELILYKKTTVKEKLFLYASLLVNMLGLLMTFTRGAWLACIVALFIILISRKYRKILYVLVAFGILVSKPVFSYIITRGNAGETILYNESAIARILSFFTSARILHDFPFGVGGGNFAEFYRKYSDGGYLLMPQSFRLKITVPTYSLEAAHNLWLQIAVEFGVVSVLLFLFIVINRLRYSLKEYKKNRGLFTSLVVYLMFSILTGVEFNHKGIITATLIIWIIFGLMQLSKAEEEIGDETSN